ncbi:hypothetical protein BKA66DRAFT_490292 [Pyrenochaeta sp. MPI-SDFR-AT-0127]|nr:hypothetical protein BKA66DRAFT_490292 [Pyrenochaeta sp. MPI-SDFR-AT-0127]
MMAARRRGPILRVRGLSASLPDVKLKATLAAAIGDNLLEEEKPQLRLDIAIVPSCYNSAEACEQERVALVEFQGGMPVFLSELTANPLQEWQMEMGDTDINFDQHFFGFTQLYTPKPGVSVTADIIAITGLDGHAYGSWRGKGNLGRMWLRDFLSKDLPCCRTMIYGYNSKLSSHGIDTIMDYGRELIEELKKVRNTEELRRRPLFFVAHSFGGIILAHCLVKAVQTDEDDHPTVASLHKATYGMLLFGIPHRGLLLDDIQKMLGKENDHPRSVLLKQIQAKSDLLTFQLADFKNLIRDRKVVSFYETEQTRRLEFDSGNQRWKRAGDFYTAVDTDSALLQLPDSIEDKIPLHLDHSMMVKFDNKNAQGYSSALDKLQQFERDAPRVVADRFLRAQRKLAPTIMVPFKRDNAFVGRHDILTQIVEKNERTASSSHSRVALVGLGGVGKSQIAIEYAYRLRETAPHTWVFWVHASNAARFEQAYRDIAARLELPGRNDAQTDILRLVRDWLSDERNGRWLIIVDNADDDRVFSSPSAEPAREAAPLASFLPQAANGWILVTSRDLIAAVNLVGPRCDVIQVNPMDEQDALALLKSKMWVDKSAEGDARMLIEALEGIPLAVTHAAAYIAVNEPRMNISTYLALFRESEENQASLLNSEEARDIRRDASVTSAVITSWQISFEQIQTTKPTAAELLSLMTMFDRQGIPEFVLYNGKTRLQFDEAVGPLFRFSLIKAQVDKQPDLQAGDQLLEMHSLVQLATKMWLQVRGQLEAWQKVALEIMAASFPNGEPETWATCRILVPHSRKMFSYVSQEWEAKLCWATTITNTAWYLFWMGDFVTAKSMCRSAVAVREKVLGEEHPETLTSVSYLGSVLERQGKYEEAEAMYQRALQGLEKILGAEHSDTLISVSNLGSVLERQGKYEEAEAMHQRALQGGEKVLGAEHPYTLISVSKLGLVLERQGKYEEAEAMHQRALQGLEKILGAEHSDTLTSVNNLGLVLERQGKYEEAEAMHQRALQGLEKILGAEHPHTLTSVNNLGSVLERQGKYKEVEVMYQRTLQGLEKILGAEHPHTLTSVNNLGSVLERQGKNKEAEAMHQRALQGREKALGAEHPETLTSVNNLGSVLERQGKYKEAEAMHQRALQGYKKALGEQHRYTVTSISHLAFVFHQQQRYPAALQLYQQAYDGFVKVLGAEHPTTRACLEHYEAARKHRVG